MVPSLTHAQANKFYIFYLVGKVYLFCSCERCKPKERMSSNNIEPVANSNCQVLASANGPFASCSLDTFLRRLVVNCESDLAYLGRFERELLCVYATLAAERCAPLLEANYKQWRWTLNCSKPKGFHPSSQNMDLLTHVERRRMSLQFQPSIVIPILNMKTA